MPQNNPLAPKYRVKKRWGEKISLLMVSGGKFAFNVERNVFATKKMIFYTICECTQIRKYLCNCEENLIDVIFSKIFLEKFQ